MYRLAYERRHQQITNHSQSKSVGPSAWAVLALPRALSMVHLHLFSRVSLLQKEEAIIALYERLYIVMLLRYWNKMNLNRIVIFWVKRDDAGT